MDGLDELGAPFAQPLLAQKSRMRRAMSVCSNVCDQMGGLVLYLSVVHSPKQVFHVLVMMLDPKTCFPGWKII